MRHTGFSLHVLPVDSPLASGRSEVLNVPSLSLLFNGIDSFDKFDAREYLLLQVVSSSILGVDIIGYSQTIASPDSEMEGFNNIL
jgi:hypothetical protein